MFPTPWNLLGRRQPQHYGTLLQTVTERESQVTAAWIDTIARGGEVVTATDVLEAASPP